MCIRDSLSLLGLILVILAYLTGVMAFAMSLAYTLLAYAIALPVISWLYAILVSVTALFERVVFGKILEKTFQKIPFLMKIEMKIRNSRLMEKIRTQSRRILRKAGIASPHRMLFIKVVECKDCRKDIPYNSRLCPYCGIKTRK